METSSAPGGRDIIAIRVGGIVFEVRANTTQATQAFTRLGNAARGLENRLRQTKTLFGGLSKSLGGATAALSGFVVALGARRLAAFTKNATLLAARVENLGTVLNNVGRIAGLNAAQIRLVEESVKRLGITTRSARQSLTQLIQANIDSAKAAKITRIAQDAAVIAGIDSSEAFNRLVVSIQRNDVRLLRNLGIVINLNQVYAKFAQTTGRTAASLTAFEKRQLLLNEVISRGAQIQGTYEASLRDSFKQFTSLRRKTEEAIKTFGEQFIPVFEKVVKVTGDWLDAFVEGQTAIGPKFLGVVAAATIALGAFSTVVGGLAVAFGAVTLAGGPLTIVLGVLAAAITGGVAAWTEYKLSVIAAEARLKKVEEQAEETAQTLFEASKILQGIADIDLPFGNTEEELEKLKVAAADLAVLFPELAEQIEFASSLDSPRELVRVFETLLPEALESTEKQIEIFGRRRVQAEEDFRRELLKTFREQEGITEALERQATSDSLRRTDVIRFRRLARELNIKAAIAQRRFNVEIKNGAEEFIKLNPLLIDTNDELKKFGDVILIAERSIIQLRQAKLTETFQEFQRGLKELEQAGNQANQIVRKLENQRDKIFKGTNLQLVRDFEAAQAQLVAATFSTEEEIFAAREAFAAAQEFESTKVRDEDLAELKLNLKAKIISEQEFSDDREKILKTFAQTQKRIEAQGRALVDVGLQALEDSAKATALASANATAQLEKQEAATERLLELARLEAEGIGPRLLKIREKFIVQSELLTKTNEELSKSLQDAQDAIVESSGLSFAGLRQVIDGALDPKVLSPKIRALVVRFKIIERSIAANRREILAKEKSFNQQFLRERKRLSEKLVKEQERLNKDLLRIQDPQAFRESTIEGLRQITKTFQDQAEDTADFLREAGGELLELGEIDKRVQNEILSGRFETVADFDRALSRLRRNSISGIKDIRSEFDKFRDAATKVTTAEGLKRIEDLFGQRLTNQILLARAELKRFETQLIEFQEAGRPRQERDDRIANQRLFNELVDQGVSIAVARTEIDRIEFEQKEALNRQEEDLQKQVTDQQTTVKGLAEERNALETAFGELVAKQTMEIERQVMLRERLVELQKEEIAGINAELAENKKAQQTLREFAGGGLTGMDPVTDPTAPGAPGVPQTRTITQQTALLTKEAQRLAEVSKKETEVLTEGFLVVSRALRSTRADAEERISNTEAWIAARTSELEAGRQKMRQAELIRKKR